MFISDKKYFLVDGKAVEAKPGVSGSLLVAEGGSLSEDDAIKYGLQGAKHHPNVLVPPINLAKEEKKDDAPPKPIVEQPWAQAAKTVELGKPSEPASLPLDNKT